MKLPYISLGKKDVEWRIEIGYLCAQKDYPPVGSIGCEMWQNRYANLLLGLPDERVNEFQARDKIFRMSLCSAVMDKGHTLDLAPIHGVFYKA